MKSGYLCCLGSSCAKSPSSWLPWEHWGFRFEVKTTSMVHSQLPEKGMKVPIPRISSPSLLCLVGQDLAFPLHHPRPRKQKAAFCSQEWRTVAKNDVKHSQILPGRDGDFCKPETWEIWACDEWGISRMYILKLFHISQMLQVLRVRGRHHNHQLGRHQWPLFFCQPRII